MIRLCGFAPTLATPACYALAESQTLNKISVQVAPHLQWGGKALDAIARALGWRSEATKMAFAASFWRSELLAQQAFGAASFWRLVPQV